LQRLEDIGARLNYALVANVLIGTGGSALVIRSLSSSDQILTRQAGFRGLPHAVVAVMIGGTLGFALYVLQVVPTLNSVVLLNAYAQVLVGSIAEVLVCWAVVGSVAEAMLRDGRGRWVSVILAASITSVLFGVYHFAHSTPIDPNLTLTRTQHPAIVGKRENRKPFTYARFASVCNALQRLTAHS
jgi:hypothetical protein